MTDTSERADPDVKPASAVAAPGARLGPALATAPASDGRRLRWAWAALLVVVAAIQLIAHPTRFEDRPAFISPHENARWVLAGAWLDTGRPELPLPRAGDLPDDIAPALVPRDAAVVDGTVVPKDFPYPLALVAALRWVHPWLAVVLSAVSGLLAVGLVGLLARALGAGRWVALGAAGLFAATTSFWSGTVGYLESGATTGVFVLLTFWLLARRARRPESTAWWLDGLAGASAAVAVGMHHGSALLLGPVLAVLALPAFGGTVRRLAATGVGGALAFAPVLAFNAWMYGSPLATGYEQGSAAIREAVGENSAGVGAGRLDLLWTHVLVYWLRPEVLALFALAAVGIALTWRARRSVRAMVTAAVVGAVPFLVFMGARPLSGGTRFETSGSWIRYSFGLFGLVAALAAIGVAAGIRRWGAAGSRRPALARRTLWALAAVAAAVALVTNLLGGQGYLMMADRMPNRTNVRNAVLQLVPGDGLVITASGDKYLWPERATLNVPFLVDPDDPTNDRKHVHLAVPDADRLTDVVARLVADGHPVYLWNDGRWFEKRAYLPLEALDNLLAERGVERQPTRLDELHHFVPAPR